jgi:hypothetical protein
MIPYPNTIIGAYLVGIIAATATVPELGLVPQFIPHELGNGLVSGFRNCKKLEKAQNKLKWLFGVTPEAYEEDDGWMG